MSKQNISIILVLILAFITIPLNISYAEIDTSLVFELGKDSFIKNEEIKGTGTVRKGDVPVSGTSVTLTVEDEAGLSLFKVGQYTTDNSGKFDVSFKLPYSVESGKYLIKIKALEKEIVKKIEYSGTDPVDPNPGNPKNPTNPVPVIKEKIEINMDSDVLSINIDPKIIESIVKNKKDLIISSKDFTLTINPDIFEKNKEYPITLNIVKKNTIRGGEYIQASPSIQLGLSIKKGDKVENLKLDKKATISIKYNDKNGLNYEKACIYRVDENGNLIFIGGKLNKDSKTIECEIDSLGVFEVLIYNKSFKDVDMAWAKDAIEVLASRHIVNGVDKDNFKPYENITRAEFCKMLISTLNIELKDSTFEFNDVDKDKWYYEYINAAAGLGLVEGYDGMFKPNDLITREAMIVMIFRASKLEKYGQSYTTVDLNFDDSESISDWSKEAVLFAKNNGIVQGVGDNRLEPKKNATRAETAVIIYKILKLKGIF